MGLSNAANSKRYLYSAYGLAIESRMPLPEFPLYDDAARFRADARVTFGDTSEWSDPVRQLPSFWSVGNDEARFWFQGIGGFQIKNGREVVIDPEPDIDGSLLRLYVEGMMMACLLHQRGYFVLHASVIQIADHAIAFLGHIGAGKSTLAAALHFRGHGVVTDDNGAVDLRGPEPLVVPAFPSVKLHPAVARSLGCSERSLRVMHFSQKKRARSVERNFPRHPVPLHRIYVLDREAEDAIVRLSPGEAVLELIRNSVPTRWRQPGDPSHLLQCAQMSRRLPVWRIRSFDTLEAIPELAHRIEQHALEQFAAVA